MVFLGESIFQAVELFFFTILIILIFIIIFFILFDKIMAPDDLKKLYNKEPNCYKINNENLSLSKYSILENLNPFLPFRKRFLFLIIYPDKINDVNLYRFADTFITSDTSEIVMIDKITGDIKYSSGKKFQIDNNNLEKIATDNYNGDVYVFNNTFDYYLNNNLNEEENILQYLNLYMTPKK